MTHDSLDLVLHTGLIHVTESLRNSSPGQDTGARGVKVMCLDGKFIPEGRWKLISG